MILANVVCGVLSLTQGLAVAALLGPANFGVIAIPLMIGWLAVHFWDLRLAEVATKLHFTAAPLQQTASARVCILLSALLGLLMLVTTAGIGIYATPLFTTVIVATAWIWLQATALAVNHVSGVMLSLMRQTGNFIAIAAMRVGAQLLYTGILLSALAAAPTLATYYSALLLAALAGLSVSALMLVVVWRKQLGHYLWQGDSRPLRATYFAQYRLFFANNMIGYARMMHRAGDVLLVGYFANDSITGIYRLAKAMLEGLSGITDALYSYYYPSFMRHLQRREYEVYAQSIRRFVAFGFGGAFVLSLLSYLGLQLAEIYVLHHQYLQLPEATAIMVASLGFMWGVHMWLWPLVVTRERTDLMATSTIVGAIVQLSLISLCALYYQPSPALMALTLLAYSVVTYLPLLIWGRINWKELS